MLAQRTWGNLGDANRLNLTMTETSLTDFLLLDLKRSHPRYVEAWKINQRREAYWGADWAWWFQGTRSSYGMLIQAKSLDVATLTYKRLDYTKQRSKIPQVDALIQAADRQTYKRKRYRMHPAYCFYNYWPKANDDPKRHCQCFPIRGTWGCSVADARHVRQCIRNSQLDLDSVRAVSSPWSCLVCCKPSGGGTTTLAEGVREFGGKMAGDYDIPDLDGVPQYINDLRDAKTEEERDAILRKVRVGGVVCISE